MVVVDDRFKDLNPKMCVVLGDKGFVGRSLVLRLLKLNNWIVQRMSLMLARNVE
ncbi:hypothetical protein JHK82_018917 [Glycine max]|nr:hypothetical protein JHK85_019357 [Glycine max]KAG5038095.1 hypothetical protein JHK86_018935 [Glycine max]KAG5143222.1 hypothetical protein JHK82_018917 [Glycine max]